MKKILLIVGAIVLVIFLASVIVSQCVDQPSDNVTVSPNLSLAQRQKILEQKYDMLLKVIDQLQRENAQLRRDLDALSRE